MADRVLIGIAPHVIGMLCHFSDIYPGSMILQLLQKQII